MKEQILENSIQFPFHHHHHHHHYNDHHQDFCISIVSISINTIIRNPRVAMPFPMFPADDTVYPGLKNNPKIESLEKLVNKVTHFVSYIASLPREEYIDFLSPRPLLCSADRLSRWIPLVQRITQHKHCLHINTSKTQPH